MESVLDFINVNYIWLILIAIVVLLALVGYIADKQGFGNSQKSKNNKAETEENKKEITEFEKIEKTNEVENNNLIKDNLNTENLLNEQKEEELIIEEPLEEINETLIEDNDSDLEINNIDNNEEDDFNIDDDFNKVLKDVENSSNDIYMEMPEEIEEESVWKF